MVIPCMEEILPPEIIRIRGSLTFSKRLFYEHLLDLVMFGLSPQLDKQCAPEKQRIGIFGPYKVGQTTESKKRIEKLANLVASLGFGAVTGEGFYQMNDPNTFHPMTDLFPGDIGILAKRALDAFEIDEQDYYFHLARLVVGAIIDLTELRTQIYEVEGSSYYNIPHMGYIFIPRFQVEDHLCHYLLNNGNTSLECSCPEHGLCDYPRLHMSIRMYCPFYEGIDLPLFLRKMFLTNNARLIAVCDDQALEYIARDFVNGNRTKLIPSTHE